MKFLATLVLVIFCASQALAQCTVTTASGTHVPAGFCSGDLIFEDNFDFLDSGKWRHDVTMGGGGNNEFQWYVNDRANSFTTAGNLHLRPTYTSDIYGEDFLYDGTVTIPEGECTHDQWFGCERGGQGRDGCYIVPPIRSSKVTTWDSFSYKYGKLEIRAKLPAGDWIWPALWLMPRYSVYGEWPRSGEIDLMESRGNRDLWAGDVHVGTQQTGSTLHYGPNWDQNGWGYAHKTINYYPGYHLDFHLYQMLWTPEALIFSVDNVEYARFDAGAGFWYRGNFNGENIWAGREPMAPFDQEFFIQFNNAIGGTAFFSDYFENRSTGQKPWLNTDPCHHRSFWHGRGQWEPTWNMFNDDRDLQVDYIKVWAL